MVVIYLILLLNNELGAMVLTELTLLPNNELVLWC